MALEVYRIRGQYPLFLTVFLLNRFGLHGPGLFSLAYPHLPGGQMAKERVLLIFHLPHYTQNTV